MFNRRATQVALERADQTIKQLKEALEDAPIVATIEQSGKTLRIGIIRNGKLHFIETYASMDLDVPALKRSLF